MANFDGIIPELVRVGYFNKINGVEAGIEDVYAKIGSPNGIAPLGENGLIEPQYLPSYVDDVLEYPNYASLPVVGEQGKIYITVDETKVWRWSGTVYIEIVASPSSTDSVPEGLNNLYYTAERAQADVVNIIGNADTANRLSTARLVQLSGDVTGSGLFNGGSNLTIATTVVDDGHNHSISTITGLSDVATSGDYSDLLNTPTLGSAASKDVPTTEDATPSQVVLGNDSRLSDARIASDVYSWAKAPTKPTYTATEVGAQVQSDDLDSISGLTGTSGVLRKIGENQYELAQDVVVDSDLTPLINAIDGKVDSSLLGLANGVATLDDNGDIPLTQLPTHIHTIASVTNLQTALDGKLGVSDTAVAATTLTGLTSTITELNYVDGVTSNVQNQLNSKVDSSQLGVANGVATLDLNGDIPLAQLPTHSHAISDISNLQTSLDGKLGVSDTAFAATTLTGLTSTITELNYVDGVTSNVQTQLNGKQPLSAELTGIAGISATSGLVKKTGAGTYSLDSTVYASVGSVTPLVDSGSTGTVGVSTTAARSDHVHPVATSVLSNSASTTSVSVGISTNGVAGTSTSISAATTSQAGVMTNSQVASLNTAISDISTLQTTVAGKEPSFSVLPVNKGGTGVSSISGVLKGNGASQLSAATSTDIVALVPDATTLQAGKMTTAQVTSLNELGGLVSLGSGVVKKTLSTTGVDTYSTAVISDLVTSTNVVTNLNADMLDGNHASDFATIIQGAKADTALQPSDIYEWAKAPTKPTYTATEVGAQPLDSDLTSIASVAGEGVLSRDSNGVWGLSDAISSSFSSPPDIYLGTTVANGINCNSIGYGVAIVGISALASYNSGCPKYFDNCSFVYLQTIRPFDSTLNNGKIQIAWPVNNVGLSKTILAYRSKSSDSMSFSDWVYVTPSNYANVNHTHTASDVGAQPLDSDLTALSNLTSTGIVVRNGTGSYKMVSIKSNASALVVTNENGVDGNPTLDLDADLKGIAALTGSNGFLKKLGTASWTLDSTSYLPLSGGSLTGDISLKGDATQALHPVTLQQLQSVLSGLKPKNSVKAATIANITLSGVQTVDDVALAAGDRVLVKNQTTASQNGIYTVATGAWTRSTDADAWLELVAALVVVEQGTVNADCGWVCTADQGGTLGTTAVTWTQFFGAGSVTAGTGISISGNQVSLATLTDSGTGSLLKLTRDAYGRVSGTSTVMASDIKSLSGLFGSVAGAALTTTGSAGTSTTPAREDHTHPKPTPADIGAQPSDADLTAIAALTGTSGLLKKTAANTWALDGLKYFSGEESPTYYGSADTFDLNDLPIGSKCLINTTSTVGGANEKFNLPPNDYGIGHWYVECKKTEVSGSSIQIAYSYSVYNVILAVRTNYSQTIGPWSAWGLINLSKNYVPTTGGTLTGNLVLSGATGLRFSNTIDSSATNTLSWYETGTYTPVLSGGTTAGTFTYSTQLGRYTRIGRMVHVDVNVTVTGTSVAPAGNLYISLPTTAISDTNKLSQSAAITNNLTITGQVFVQTQSGSTNASVLVVNNGVSTAMSSSNDTTFTIQFSLAYVAA